jgi:2-dehydropantoate 2-reductase
MTTSSLSIGIAGAGSIGCFVGGCLAEGGHRVTLLARPRIRNAIATHGLRLTGYDGMDTNIPADRLTLSDDPAVLHDSEVVLVTVKSGDTAAIADLIAAHARPDAIIVSLQNGVDNVAILRARLPDRAVLGGMVPFNVQPQGEAHYHRATSGDIVLADDPSGLAARLSVPLLKLLPTGDIEAVQWGKLIINLNNALNALAGIPLRDQLAGRAWRRLLADQMAEALKVMKAARIRIAPMTQLPPAVTPYLLRLPDRPFHLLLGRILQIDPQARSSMWDDLARRRKTEVDQLQGVVVRLAGDHGLRAPLSERVVALIHEAEARGEGSPGLTPPEIRA